MKLVRQSSFRRNILVHGEVVGCIVKQEVGYLVKVDGVRWSPFRSSPLGPQHLPVVGELPYTICRLLRHAKALALDALLTLGRSASGGSVREPQPYNHEETAVNNDELLTMAEMHMDKIPNKGHLVGAMRQAYSTGIRKGAEMQKAVYAAKPDPNSRIGTILQAIRATARGEIAHPHLTAQDYAFLAQYINKEVQ